jgi:competence protein ComFC
MSMPGKPAYRLYQWFWSGLDLLYPPTCGGCGKQGERWCASCQRKVYRVEAPVCDCCGQRQRYSGLCPRCLLNRPPYTAVRSWAIFDGPIRAALHRLKYKRDVSLGEVLGRPLIGFLHELGWQVEKVIPVPLGVARLRERGYNQTALIARPLALGAGIAYCPQALRRIRETRSQVGLSILQRKENVAGAFQANPKWATGRSLLVLDDVATSGATLEACATALMKAGARQVYGLTLARAI